MRDKVKNIHHHIYIYIYIYIYIKEYNVCKNGHKTTVLVMRERYNKTTLHPLNHSPPI